MTFKDGNYPRQFVWNNISFNLDTAMNEALLSHQYEHTYAIHKFYGQSGDTWNYYKVILSLYPHETVIRIMKSHAQCNIYEEMQPYCAILFDGKYRPPTDERYAKHFPSYDDVCNYTYQQYERFFKLYFLDKV